MNYKVSVITAVYNVADYLEEMIDSIVTQSIGFENVQLVLVDDGSQDDSGKICDDYAQKYPDNIVAIHKENGGVSSARNEGLRYAEGEYYNFCDADDKLEQQALEKMYEYMEENKEWIDLVAIPLKFFGARSTEHPLNFRFRNTKIVDLRQEYSWIHLSSSSALIKSECFAARRFDTRLCYAEDAQVVTDILLDKMRYGVVSGVKYLYRKREAGDSAIDTGRMKSTYYVPCMEYFIKKSIDTALEKKKYLPKFVQYVCMYDLQWRLNKYPLIEKDVLSAVEEEQYRELLLYAIKHIDNDVIMQQKNINDNYKLSIISLKNSQEKELQLSKEDICICIGDVKSCGQGAYSSFYEFLQFKQKKVEIEGYLRCLAELSDIQILLKDVRNDIEYEAETFLREEKNTFLMDKVIARAVGFKVSLEISQLPIDSHLKLYIRYRQHDILCRNILFSKFFPLAKQLKNSYLYEENLLFTYSADELRIERADKNIAKRQERKLLNELYSSKDRMRKRGAIARIIYGILNKYKRKEIWLVSDRLNKADDNGEAFFTYIAKQCKQDNIQAYFVLKKESPDYERLCKIGKVVFFDSLKYKILCLLCDKIVSSQGEDYVFNRFFNLSYMYKDILHRQKFIFLQHGVTKDDLSRWLDRYNKNISLFVTTTRAEYQSVLEGAYHYSEEQIKLTGFPRHDFLQDTSENNRLITFMPTWRSYLAGNVDVKTGGRTLKSGFENSEFYLMYQQVLGNKLLYDAAEKYSYKIRIMLHPTMPRECLDYFKWDERLHVLDLTQRYRTLFAETNLIITDYSSTVFDFAYLRKPVLYYQQDKDEFFSGKHTYDKGYFDYERDGFGEVEYTADALIERIIEYMSSGCQLKPQYLTRINNTFPYHDKDNCHRVYEEIKSLG